MTPSAATGDDVLGVFAGLHEELGEDVLGVFAGLHEELGEDERRRANPSGEVLAMASATVPMHVRDGLVVSGLTAGMLTVGTGSGADRWAGRLAAPRGALRWLDSDRTAELGAELSLRHSISSFLPLIGGRLERAAGSPGAWARHTAAGWARVGPPGPDLGRRMAALGASHEAGRARALETVDMLVSRAAREMLVPQIQAPDVLPGDEVAADGESVADAQREVYAQLSETRRQIDNLLQRVEQARKQSGRPGGGGEQNQIKALTVTAGRLRHALEGTVGALTAPLVEAPTLEAPISDLERVARAMSDVPAYVAVGRHDVPDLTDEPLENVRRLFGLTVAQLADLFSVTERQMHRYLREGLPEARRSLADALVAIGLTVIGGRGVDGARAWLYGGRPPRAELTKQGRIHELADEADAYRDSPFT
jgi:hypothetical protein